MRLGKRTTAIAVGVSLLMGFSLSGCGEEPQGRAKGSTLRSASLQEEEPLEEVEPYDTMTREQRNSINMLNYMTVLAQEINEDKGNQLFLEKVYSSLVNGLYPNAVDVKTQAQINHLLDTINDYRMIEVKRDRMQFIYDQNKARALRESAVELAGLIDENPVKLIRRLVKNNMLSLAAQALNMAVESVSSYHSTTSLADRQFLKEGWELEDEQARRLHESTKEALNYMFSMVRDYDLPGEYILSPEAVEDYVTWSGKPSSQMANKIAWLESHEETYQAFGMYWLGMVKLYFDNGDYEKCLQALKRYERLGIRIFRKDQDYASALPMALIAARETLQEPEYLCMAEKYCPLILDNLKDEDWSLRYFAAQVYLDLYSLTEEDQFLREAYQAAFDNVVVLVDGQREQNALYLGALMKVKTGEGATDREKKEIKAYNKEMEREREIALPPVSEPLYLNCRMVFELAPLLGLSQEEKQEVDAILHEKGENLFLTKGLDEDFWFYPKDQQEETEPLPLKASFEKDSCSLPALCLSECARVSVRVKREEGEDLLDDWVVKKVERPKKSGYEKFQVTLSSKEGKKYDFKKGDQVTVSVSPMGEEEGEDFVFQCRSKKVAFVSTMLLEFKRLSE